MVTLLSTKEKKRLSRMYFTKLLCAFFLMTGLLILIVGFFELPSYIYLSHRLSGVVQTDVSSENNATMVGEFQERRVKEIASRLSSDEDEFVTQVENLRRHISGNIQLNSLSLEEGVWKVSGWAPNRSDLLALTDSLERQEWIREVNLPVEALAKSSDISFNLSVTPQ